MKLAVIGAVAGADSVMRLARDVGRAIANKGSVLLTGAATGYGHAACLGAMEMGGLVVGISPAAEVSEHKRMGLPADAFDVIVYTGFGYKGRNVVLVNSCDAAIMVGGKAGTLNEFTIAFDSGKVIGVLTGSGGATGLIKEISEVCDKNGEKNNVVYSDDPEKLVDEVVRLVRSLS
ncbi:MAG: hypothetical protein ABH879_10840 [archaeon]